jgi:hypothetical protein
MTYLTTAASHRILLQRIRIEATCKTPDTRNGERVTRSNGEPRQPLELCTVENAIPGCSSF